MITLITGTPGSGKTAYALDMMIRLQKLDNARPLFVHGIPDLKLPHQIVVCESSTCDYCTTLINRDDYPHALHWHEWAPQGAIFFFDEVQNIHRPRHSSAAVPPCVATYEVHRHRGLDFFMITQNPMLIDSNIRSLVSRHIHLTATWARRVQHEWAQCKTDVSSTTEESIKSNYVLPKDVFKLYKSASLHTTVQRKKPWVLYAIPVILVFIFVGFSSLANRVSAAATPQDIDQKDIPPQPQPQPPPPPPPVAGSGKDAQAAYPLPATLSIPHEKLIPLDLRVFFRKWILNGVPDEDLHLLPVGMCSFSTKSVKCKFPSTMSYRDMFTNITCSKSDCFVFLPRVAPPKENDHVLPSPMSIPILTTASN